MLDDDDKGQRREPDGNHYVLHGSFSPAPLATPTGLCGKRADGVELSQLRQRQAVTTGQGTLLGLFALILCVLIV